MFNINSIPTYAFIIAKFTLDVNAYTYVVYFLENLSFSKNGTFNSTHVQSSIKRFSNFTVSLPIFKVIVIRQLGCDGLLISIHFSISFFP
ncbi:hypothetical protein, partial [Staphylococcus aureus]